VRWRERELPHARVPRYVARQVSSHRQDEAYVRRPAQKDVFVGEAGRNRALHGDVVAVELLPESRWRRNFRHASSSAAKSALVNAAPVDAQSDLWLPTIPAHFLGGAPAAEDLGKRLGALKVAVATGSGAAAAADDAQPAGVVRVLAGLARGLTAGAGRGGAGCQRRPGDEPGARGPGECMHVCGRAGGLVVGEEAFQALTEENSARKSGPCRCPRAGRASACTPTWHLRCSKCVANQQRRLAS
jgi:hypothetical protein